jgi:hypothetical protein
VTTTRTIGFIEAKEQKLRCSCGHARSSHRSATHKHYELGACTAKVKIPIGDSECPCLEYLPVRPA